MIQSLPLDKYLMGGRWRVVTSRLREGEGSRSWAWTLNRQHKETRFWSSGSWDGLKARHLERRQDTGTGFWAKCQQESRQETKWKWGSFRNGAWTVPACCGLVQSYWSSEAELEGGSNYTAGLLPPLFLPLTLQLKVKIFLASLVGYLLHSGQFKVKRRSPLLPMDSLLGWCRHSVVRNPGSLQGMLLLWVWCILRRLLGLAGGLTELQLGRLWTLDWVTPSTHPSPTSFQQLDQRDLKNLVILNEKENGIVLVQRECNKKIIKSSQSDQKRTNIHQKSIPWSREHAGELQKASEGKDPDERP